MKGYNPNIIPTIYLFCYVLFSFTIYSSLIEGFLGYIFLTYRVPMVLGGFLRERIYQGLVREKKGYICIQTVRTGIRGESLEDGDRGKTEKD